MTPLLKFWIAHRAELAALFGQHVLLVAISTAMAVALGVPLGIFASRRPRLSAPVVGFANIVQTVPSLAMFGFLLPVPLIGGVGARAAVVVLILYGLLPILRTTIAGLQGIDPSVREAGVAMGMTPGELLRKVELPLAVPSIVAGIRVAAVVGVGSATIAAAIGAGGLGEYIYRGLSMVDTTVIFAGAIPAALLALAVDGLLLIVQRQLLARRRRGSRRVVVAAVALALAAVGTGGLLARTTSGTIVVGSKNFTEQLVLGELVAQAIERDTHLPVERRLNLGGTLICDRAELTGDVDVYVEYTGTALTAIFRQPVASDSGTVYATVRDLYARSGRTLLSPLGFNNTFAILVRGDDARALGLRTIDDVVPKAPAWRAGFGYEFLERPDGFPGLAKAYGLHFSAPPRVMDLTLTYRALAGKQVDLIAGDATAGLIKGLDLVQLVDNRHYFPPYDAAPVARSEMLLRHPEVRAALERLGGRVSASDMRAMNYAADVEHRDIGQVVREFLAHRGA
ncbi:MAG TPA: glycine betaine ABC transporter substrate-binding protein [Vicinamibacterales bacterium]|jgi:osmoprotectant transport system permease protein|nr:glycine betaine ABC transporter substrate-binding protein [Vicinamibacterales bacterium]